MRRTRIFLLCVIVFTIGVSACNLPWSFFIEEELVPTPAEPVATESDSSETQETLVIGHRGAAGLAPENTLVAIQIAIDLGVDAVEFDIHRSADGELVVIHDEEVDRTTNGSGFVMNKTLAELQALDAGSWFGEEFTGETIPSLREVFDLVRDSDVLLFIELKNPAIYSGIEADLVALIEEYDYADRVSILSFNHQSLEIVRELAPDLTLSGLWSQQLPSSDGGGFDVVNARYTLYQGRPRSIENYHEQGLLVMAWTVDEVGAMEWLLSRNIDGITTNYPDLLLAAMGR